MAEGIRAEGADCPVDYDAVVDSFPLTQGVSASASSSFKNDCGYTGEVYAHAYAKATNAANQVATMTQSDPAPGASAGTPRTIVCTKTWGTCEAFRFT